MYTAAHCIGFIVWEDSVGFHDKKLKKSALDLVRKERVGLALEEKKNSRRWIIILIVCNKTWPCQPSTLTSTNVCAAGKKQ